MVPMARPCVIPSMQWAASSMSRGRDFAQTP